MHGENLCQSCNTKRRMSRSWINSTSISDK